MQTLKVTVLHRAMLPRAGFDCSWRIGIGSISSEFGNPTSAYAGLAKLPGLFSVAWNCGGRLLLASANARRTPSALRSAV